MSEQSSGTSALYFLVGGLLVAVLAIGYFGFGVGRGDAGSDAAVSSGTVGGGGTEFKIDIDKKGGVSGTIKQESTP